MIPQRGRSRSGSLSSSDHSGDKAARTDTTKDEAIVEYLRHVTSNNPDRSYAAEFRFFLESKGRSLSDADSIRAFTFAVKFAERWQDARITLDVRQSIDLLNIDNFL